MKRLTLLQVNLILIILYIIFIPILVIYAKGEILGRDTWIEDNKDEIQELTATVTDSKYHGGRSRYYEVSLEVSNGDHRVYKLGNNLSGTISIYCITVDNRNYYGFNQEELYWEVKENKSVVSSVVVMFLIFGPIMLYLFLRETYGYGIRWKKGTNNF